MRIKDLEPKLKPYLDACAELRNVFEHSKEIFFSDNPDDPEFEKEGGICLSDAAPTQGSADFAVMLGHEMKHAELHNYDAKGDCVEQEQVCYAFQEFLRVQLKYLGHELTDESESLTPDEVESVYRRYYDGDGELIPLEDVIKEHEEKSDN